MSLLTLMASSDSTAVTISVPTCVVLILHHWLMSLLTLMASSDSTAVTISVPTCVVLILHHWLMSRCNIRTTQVGTLMVTAVVRWCHECKKTHHPVLKYQNYTGRYTYSDFIWPFLRPYMGVIPNPKMAFIFPTSCILALIFPIL